LPGVGALDPNQAPRAIDVPEAKRTQLAEAKTGAECDVEEMDVKEIRLVVDWIGRCELDERSPDRIRVLGRDLPAGELGRRREVGLGRRVR
jgi:hypothetical protein